MHDRRWYLGDPDVLMTRVIHLIKKMMKLASFLDHGGACVIKKRHFVTT